MNRFDAAWFALRPIAGYTYFPSLPEILIQMGVICGIITVYTLVGHYLPLFEGTIRPEDEPVYRPTGQPQTQTAH
jgi:Ni/Fe-hydrogenase subunit HybB-like protein